MSKPRVVWVVEVRSKRRDWRPVESGWSDDHTQAATRRVDAERAKADCEYMEQDQREYRVAKYVRSER